MAALNLQQQEDSSMAVLDLVVCHINSVYTLARLSAVNKQCRDLCALQATHQLQTLLLPALRRAAAVPELPLYEQHITDITWLCSVADKGAFAAASAAVLAVPNVPALTALLLAEAGVRVSDQAVLAAALKQQPGAELWLETMDVVSGRTQLPLARLTAQLRTGTGTLHEEEAAAAAAAAQEAPLMELLLRSKCLGEWVGGSKRCFELPAAAYWLCAALLLSNRHAALMPSLHNMCQMLLAIVVPYLAGAAASACRNETNVCALRCPARCGVFHPFYCLQFCYLPSVLLLLHPSHIQALLRVAVNARDPDLALMIVEHLIRSSSQLLDAIHKCQHLHLPPNLERLVKKHVVEFPIALQQLQQELQASEAEIPTIHAQQLQQVTPQLLDDLLLLAVARQHSKLIPQLLKLPASQQLQSSTVFKLLQYTICTHSNKLQDRTAQLTLLCQLPAAELIDTAQLSSLLLEAVNKRQFTSIMKLSDLPAEQLLGSSQKRDITMAAVRTGWWAPLFLADELQPQHMYELLHEAILVAAFAGAAMRMWCDTIGGGRSVSYADVEYDDPAVPAEIAAIKLLCGCGAAFALSVEHIEQLLLTAAALGNVGAVAVLCKELPGVLGIGRAAALKLLQISLQLRSCSMMSAVSQLGPFSIDFGDLTESLMGLMRTNDLLQLAWALNQFSDEPLISAAKPLLLAAVQLGRRQLVAALCCKQGWPAHESFLPVEVDKLCASEAQDLLRLAVRIGNASTVQQLLQLPAAAQLPAGGLQLVMNESAVRTGYPQACSGSTTNWTLQPQQMLLQQRRQQQEQQEGQVLCSADVLQAMRSGQLPDARVRAALQPGPARDAAAMCEEDREGVQQVTHLLAAALQLPAGPHQRAWVALLSRSEKARHIWYKGKSELLSAAVHAGCVSSWGGALRALCNAWPNVAVHVAYSLLAAAVQLGCMPAVRTLLGVPGVQELDAGRVVTLLRWGIHSNSREPVSRQMPRCSCQPCPPGCTVAHAEVFAAICTLPAAQRIVGIALVGLLVFAMQQGNVEAVQQLCRLAGAQQLSTAYVRGVLRLARVVGSRPGRDAVVGALCELRGARGLAAADVGQLMQGYESVDVLMGWSAAESEQAGVVPAEVCLLG
jgi:hypothetical protein